eukprot:Seg1001.15 transcript_id=Seg1001.15/GoldUCD/mRNA.D3Y31 product="Tubulin-specific chaperone D" protein_id=Seg1001.15/GoldUCD/D3Y31
MAGELESNSNAEKKKLRATHIRERFMENEEVIGIIKRVQDICKDWMSLEADLEMMTRILDLYQEQPNLLDPYLENMVENCLIIVKLPNVPPEAFHQTFKYLYLITKTRGAKYVIRLFTHEVADMEPVINLLSQQRTVDFNTWQTRYILLLWLSMICMIPFDLVKFDGAAKGENKSVIDRILDIAKRYVAVTDKSRDAAALLLSKFMSRSDVKKLRLSEFLDWCLMILMKADDKEKEGVSSMIFIMTTLARLFKFGKRDDLLKYVDVIFDKIIEKDFLGTIVTLLKKLNMKVVQRLGLCLLKPRIAAWRYQRGNRLLVYNLQNPSANNSNLQMADGEKKQDEEESYDVPESIELVLQQLLLGLRDWDTVVRWSAAKGIGRITGRLPKELADDVITSILEFLSPMETDMGWHGGCLALAELGTRGLLLPERLSEVVPVILKALVFDEKRGTYSLGSHVRDAACYVCWSFARAYEPKELTDHVTQIASTLIVVSIFDREPNCRRAASAAFQENVGRQGTFPHGIDIVTTVDYYAVGNLSHCFLNLSSYIASFPEYTQPVIDHLASMKISHWDSKIRALASKALFQLTSIAPDYMLNKVLPQVLECTNSIDLNTRHGGILATAEVTHALCQHFKNKNPAKLLESKILDQLKGIVPRLKENQHFRGVTGDTMRMAVFKLIETLSICKFPFHQDPVIDVWRFVIDESLSSTEANVQEEASKALSELCKTYYETTNDAALGKIQDSLIDTYLEKLKSDLRFDRMGFALGLGALPAFLIQRKKTKILDGLLNATLIEKGKEGLYAEARSNAVKALTSICEEIGVTGNSTDSNCINAEELMQIFEKLLLCMEDYSIDSRGDVGAWDREAAMSGLEKICNLIVNTDLALCPEHICKRIMCSLVQQASEKIDRTRGCAGEIFQRLIHLKPKLAHIPHHKELQQLFPESEIGEINWTVPAIAFPRMTRLLSLSSYKYSALLGFIVSVGGLTESLVRHSSQSLLQFLAEEQMSSDQRGEFGEEILNIFRQNKKNDRVTIPLFRMLDLLISNGSFDSYIDDISMEFPVKLVTLAKEEVARSGNAKKLVDSVKVFCGLLQFPGETRKKALSQLMTYLCHKYPRVRKETSEHLYTTFITFEDIIKEENFENCLSILMETEWDGKLEQLRDKRNILCDFIGVPRPKLKSKAKEDRPSKQVDELDSYQAVYVLVRVPGCNDVTVTSNILGRKNNGRTT